ncbi:hypothetical protein FHX14_003645 [Rhizobium sp. BK619]|nr:hypothetical protein [Rhizobium sp. BK619]
MSLAMVHSRPYPVTADGRSTSVGTLAIYGFLRPVSSQDFPSEILPKPLRQQVAAVAKCTTLCLQRHGIGRLLDVDGDRPAKKKFKSYPIGYSTSTLPRCALNKASCICSLPSIAPKFAFVELHEKATTSISREFLLRLIAAVPYKIHTVFTDNGIQFTTPGAGGSAVPLIKKRSPMANVSGSMLSNTPAPPMISNTEGQLGETPELQRIMRQELRSLWADRSNRFRSRAFRTILAFI